MTAVAAKFGLLSSREESVLVKTLELFISFCKLELPETPDSLLILKVREETDGRALSRRLHASYLVSIGAGADSRRNLLIELELQSETCPISGCGGADARAVTGVWCVGCLGWNWWASGCAGVLLGWSGVRDRYPGRGRSFGRGQ